MKSMTGFGRATTPLGNFQLTVQVSSVNRRSLELVVNLPEEWQELEPLVGERVRAVASRGRVSLWIDARPPESASDGFADPVAVGHWLDHLASLAAARGLPFAPTTELLWQIANSQRGAPALPPVAPAGPTVLALVDTALAGFAAMRAHEGAVLRADCMSRAAILRVHLAAIAERAPLVPGICRENLQRRLREAGLAIDLDDERVLKEIALFADRCDITEEITRARSHLDQLDTLLGSEGELGRKAEFLLQELGREINTTGSKANDLAIAKLVIESKNELERLREQLANVE